MAAAPASVYQTNRQQWRAAERAERKKRL